MSGIIDNLSSAAQASGRDNEDRAKETADTVKGKVDEGRENAAESVGNQRKPLTEQAGDMFGSLTGNNKAERDNELNKAAGKTQSKIAPDDGNSDGKTLAQNVVDKANELIGNTGKQ